MTGSMYAHLLFLACMCFSSWMGGIAVGQLWQGHRSVLVILATVFSTVALALFTVLLFMVR